MPCKKQNLIFELHSKNVSGTQFIRICTFTSNTSCSTILGVQQKEIKNVYLSEDKQKFFPNVSTSNKKSQQKNQRLTMQQQTKILLTACNVVVSTSTTLHPSMQHGSVLILLLACQKYSTVIRMKWCICTYHRQIWPIIVGYQPLFISLCRVHQIPNH